MRENTRNPAPPAASKANSKTNGTNGSVSERKTRSKTRSSDDKIWDFPASGNTLNVLMAAQADVFELELGSIRPLEASSQEDKRANRAKSGSLRHDLPAWEIPCKIDLRMWEGDEPTGKSFVGDGITDRGQKDKALFVRKEVHEAMAKGFVTNSTDGSTRLRIDMDEPLKVNTGPLVARSSVHPKFLIEVFVWFEDRARSKILLEEICGQTKPQYQRVGESTASNLSPSNSNCFYVRWKGDLAELPSQNHLLELSHFRNTQMASLGSGLEVTMRLNSPRAKSVLQNHNSFQRQLSSQSSSNTATTTTSSREPREIVKIIYILRSSSQQHEIKYDEYICPLCNNTNLHTFDVFHLHLYHNHTLFNFEVDRHNAHRDGNHLITVRIGIEATRTDLPPSTRRKDAEPTSPPGLFPERWRCSPSDDLSWLTPSRPFDPSQYQDGDHSWFHEGHEMEPWVRSELSTRASAAATRLPILSTATSSDSANSDGAGDIIADGSRPSGGLVLTRRGGRNGNGNSNGLASATPTTRNGVKPKDPSAVPPIPVPKRKRFRVPPAPHGLSFFRTVTKQPLSAGEHVSESDDDGVEDGDDGDGVRALTAGLQRHLQQWQQGAAAPQQGPQQGYGVQQQQQGGPQQWPREAVEFMAVFDGYLAGENVNGDVHLGDALVRFVRIKGVELRRKGLGPELRKKVGELCEDGIVGEEVRRFCEGFVGEDGREEGEKEGDREKGEGRTNGKGKEKERENDGEDVVMATPRRKVNGVAGGKASGGTTPRTRANYRRRILRDSDDEMETDEKKDTRPDQDGDVEMVDDSTLEDTVVVKPLEETASTKAARIRVAHVWTIILHVLVLIEDSQAGCALSAQSDRASN
ncbi:MAG: hypothetical protein Q9165_003579 [Trypethelium subeluteriae]